MRRATPAACVQSPLCEPDSPSEPNSPRPAASRCRPAARGLLWLLVSLALLFPAAAMSTQPVAAAGSCTGWTSTTRPPSSIRVLNRSGRVERVDFRRYVGIVMASGEWPSRMPTTLLQAGAVAVKQFAWYHTLRGNHRRSFVTPGGQCYDVVSTTRDQMYVPSRASVTAKQWNAIDATWGLSVRKGGRFILTAYRAGSATRCGSDAVGKRLYQRSARDCARNRGYSAREILRTYYGPNVSFRGAGGGGGTANAGSADSQAPAAAGRQRATNRGGQRERAAQRQRRPSQAVRQPAAPAVQVVPWWQPALGEQPAPDALGQAGPGDVGARAAVHTPTEIRITTAGGATDQFPPLVARSAPTDTAAAAARTTVSFVGRSVRLAAVPGPAGDVVSVYIDDELVAMIDTSWSAAHEEVVIFEREWDDEELHSVELLLSGPSEQLRLELDANQIHY